jgi:hypothetical protein
MSPEKRIVSALQKLAQAGQTKVWINDLYTEVGSLDFARPREFEQMLIEMFAVGLIEIAAAEMNVGSAGSRDRITEVRLGWKHPPRIDPLGSSTHKQN